jgi:two-component system sensor histidine kinase TctE
VLRATVPYSALEAFEADNRSRMFYRVSNLQGELVSGFGDLPFWRGEIPAAAALRGAGRLLRRPLPRRSRARGRAAAAGGQRHRPRHGRGAGGRDAGAAARAGARDPGRHLWQQAAAGRGDRPGGGVVVQRATRPVRRLSARLQARPEATSRRCPHPDAPRELLPLVDATNEVMAGWPSCWTTRSASCATPRTSCARRWRCSRRRCSRRCAATSSRGRRCWKSTPPSTAPPCWPTRCCRWPRWNSCAQQATAGARPGRHRARDGAGPVAAGGRRDLDFDIATQPAPVRAHEWMLRELTRNLLHNAIRHSPAGGHAVGARAWPTAAGRR